MHDLLPFIISGLTAGSIYGIAGVGLVLTYRTSGVFNFAHGAVAAVGAYAFWELHTRHGWPWPLAAAVSIVVLGPALGVLLERLGRALAEVRPAMRVVATVGLLLVIQGLLAIIYGAATRPSPRFLPGSTALTVFDVALGWDQILTGLIGIAAVAGLTQVLKRTRTGIAMRGVVDDSTLLGLLAMSPVRVRRTAWIYGSAVAVASGILIAPVLGLDPLLLTLLVVAAFGAAAIGRFSSLPLTYAGGILVGVGAALAQRYVGSSRVAAGIPSSFPFIVLFAVLVLAKPGRLFSEPGGRRRIISTAEILPPAVRWIGYAVLAAGLLLVPQVVGSRLPVYLNGLTMAVIFLSLGLLVHLSDQVSLCHAAFAAVGATTLSHLAHGLGLPWPLALFGAGLAAVPLGAAVALPAIRLAGVYLALATFGLGLLLQRTVYPSALMFGGGGFRTVPRPVVPGVSGTSDTAFYYVVLAVAVAAALLVTALTRTRLGRLLRAMADSPIALATHGTSVTTLRVIVFCLSAFLAGIGGALLGAGATAAQSFAGFGPFESLTWLTVLLIAGTSLVRGALVAGLLLSVVPAYLGTTYTEWQTVGFGLIAILAALSADGRWDLAGRLRLATGRAAFRVEGRSRLRERMADEPFPGRRAARTPVGSEAL
ncbi:MAG TPA: ABC transporter permease [Acidimicrobiia bacterium]|nr:ABC transporter permease [Acidimicrobiia bacterium]